jgi:cobalamin biosynthesis Co2+ chelatase CbiK
MKKALLIVMMGTTHHIRAKKANGTIYVDHPAITVVEGMTKALLVER